MKTDNQTTEISRSQAKALRSEISKLVDTRKKGSMDLCRIVYQSFNSMVSVGGDIVYVWQLWGHKSWDDFVGLELHLHPTTAYVYKRIYQRFYIDLAGCWEVGNLLPITKMRILCADHGLTQRNVNAKLKRAAGKTCKKLAAEVYGVEELRSFHASVSGHELKTLRRVIAKARKAFGNEDMPRGQVITRVAREWDTVNTNLERTAKGKLRLVS